MACSGPIRINEFSSNGLKLALVYLQTLKERLIRV